ncbi:MAG TPA: molybdenum cofactor guanylyltransferase [Candidatus Limnocylindrales bacterium]|nr:molybdenum cofactor guanylyltransferase [Candidatus Limnocylindrales bacterium]
MYAAIVLAGGEGSRMGGVLKPLLPIAGEPILGRVLRAVGDAGRIVVVGPEELRAAMPPEAELTREEPPGGGPVRGLAAGWARCEGADEVAVVAADLPFLTRGALAALRQLKRGTAVYVDDEGRWQSMVSLWRAPVLSRALLPVPPRSMKDLLRGAGDVAEVRWTGSGPPPWFDCDTQEDLALAERLL